LFDPLLGIYELLLIQKKSMKLNDYRKKVECFDSVTQNKSIEEVEDMVKISENHPL
jgi:type IV secretory pathway TrbF-like protein